MQSVFMSVRREKITYFLDLKEEDTGFDLKKHLEGIIKIDPEQFVVLDAETDKLIEDKLTLADNGLTQETGKAQSPAQLKLVYLLEDGETMEETEVVPYSSPPDLPDVMKPHENADDTEQ